MNTRPDTGGGPLETFALWAFLTAVLVIGLVWGVGVLVGSILGAGLPAGGDGIAAILRTFPDIGRAWTSPIPSPLVWSAVVMVIVAMAPLVRWLVSMFRSESRGAEWADTSDLLRAELLICDLAVPRSMLEPDPADG